MYVKKAISCAIVLLVMFFFVGTSYGATASFSWLPNTESDVAGYKLYYGNASRDYEVILDVGKPEPVDGRVQYTIEGAPDGMAYYAVTAYSGTEESDFSTEVAYDPPLSSPGDFKQIIITITVN